MKHLNFFSKSSSQSCGHSSVTLASTVGSPSAHRRGAMLKLLSVLVLVLTLGAGQMWGATKTVTWTISGVATTANNARVNTALNTSSKNPNTETGVWTALGNSDNTSSYANSSSGAQLGASNNREFKGTITLSNTAIPSNATITKIAVDGKSNGTYTISATVGGTSYGSAITFNSTSVSTKNITGSKIGNSIVLTVNTTTASKYLNISKIAVTYNEAEATPYTVRFYKTDGTYQDIAEGSIGAGVTPPTMQNSCSGWTFQGWSTSYSNSQESTVALSKVTLTNGKYYPTAATTLYPVYTKTVSGSSATTTFNFSYTDWGKNSQFSGDTYSEVEQEDDGVTVTYTRNSGSLYANNTSLRFYKSNELTFDAGDNTISAISFTGSVGQEDITTNVNTCTNTSSSLSWAGSANSVTFTRPSNASSYATLSSATVTHTGGSVTYYYSYPNCCDPLGQINGSVSVTNQRSLTLQWDNLSGVDGTTPYTITCKQGSADAGTIGDVDLSGSKATCTVTGLACSTTYTFTITAHGDATHCDKTQENIQGTTSDAMTLPTLTYSTGLNAGGANINPSWATTPTHDGTVTYESSNSSVVQIINASTGEAKPVGAGTATITATYAQSANNCEASQTSNSISVTGNVTVTFNANGGSGTMQNQSIQVSTPTALTANAFTTPSSCKYFYGWATSQANADAGTRAYTDGQSVTITEGLNLYAIWKSYNYTVTKGTGTGAATFSLSADNVDCGGSITVTATPDATHKGNPIVSISPSNKGSVSGTTISNITAAITVNVEFAAKESYAITWIVNDAPYAPHQEELDGKVNGDALVYEGGAITTLPTAPGDLTLGCANRFMGWSTHDYKSVKKAASDYDDLFSDAEHAPEIEGETIFYAVFAHSEGTPLVEIFSEDFASLTDGSIASPSSTETTTTVLTQFSNVDKAYPAGGAVKLGGSKGSGYITTEELTIAAGTKIKISFDVQGWTSVEGTLDISSDNEAFEEQSVEYTATQSGSMEHKSIEVTVAVANPSITFATSAKRAFLDNILITSGGQTISDYVTECAAVEAPTFSPAAGEYGAAQSVTIASATDDAKVYYTKTTDGSTPADPTASSTEATSAITVDQNTKIKAIAIKGDDKSAIVPAEYTFKVATPTISGSTSFVSSATVTITAAEGTSIYYTTNGNEPTTGSTPYTVPFTVDADGTTTVKAIAVKSNWTNSAIASQTFTKITPLTVAQARTAIDAGGDLSNKFVKGIISQIDSYNSTYNSITYWISDDGTTTNQLEVYGGLAGVIKAAFESTADIREGEEVIVNGTLKKYNSTYEFDKDNIVVAYRPYSPIAWSAGACTAELNGEENEYPTLSGTTGLTISYQSTTPATATINGSGEVTPVNVGTTKIKATSAANDNYVATTVEYDLTVSPTVARVDLDIECNGATSGCPETTHLVKQTNLPNPLPVVAKTGKNFGGWYTDNTFQTPAVAGATITVATTLYAKWDNPYTVAQALTIISGLGDNSENITSTEYYYVAGVVTDDAVSVSSNTATYFIKDAGVENELKVYKGKGLNNANVTDASQIQEGDQVVLYGQLQNYFGTGEVAQGNYIYSRATVDVESVSLPSTANVRAGKTVALTATITPSNATDKVVTWESDDEEVATVENGVVTGVAEGTATITVTTHDGGKTATCTVTVAAGIPTFTEDDHEWIKVTNASKLVAGRFYVIAESANGKTATTSISSSVMGQVASTFSSDKSVIASGDLGTNTAIFELGGNSTDGWTLYEVTDEENTGYFSGANAASFGWSESEAVTPISFNDDGKAILGNASGYRLLYNSSSPRFKTYNSSLSNSMLLPQLYKWSEQSHAVTFDANGGVAESVPGVERTDEGKIIIPETEPTHSDVTQAFGGWYKSDAPSVLYTAGDEFSTSADVTLYAKWTTVPTYTVTYVPGGSGTVPAVASYREGQKVQVVEAELSNAGYSFAGWTVKDADQNVLPLDEENKFTMPAKNVTITAVWSRISNQKWKLVEQGDELVIDGEYVIAYSSNTTQKALGAISSNIGTAINVSIDGNYLKGSEAMKVLTLKKGKDNENYAFKNGDNYLTWSSGNSLSESTTLNNASSWTIDIDENNKVDIKNVGTTTRYLQYNTGSPRFACYTNSQQKVLLFKKVANLIVEDEQTKTAAQVNATDITVKEDGKLTINVDAEGKEIGDITVEDGGELIISGSKHIKANNVYISSTMASGKSSQMSGALAQLDIQGEVYFDITLGDGGNANKWHAFTVPFPVDANSGVYDLDNNKLNNEEHYAIMDYHGDIRATGAYGWKKYRKVLVPGTFYIMTVDGLRTTYRFKKTTDGALVAGNSKEIFEYAKSGDGQTTDAGWNGVGNPTLMYGKVNAEVQVLDPVSYTYKKKDANTTNFVVGTPFFYQASEAGSLAMLTADAGASYAPARTQAKGIEKIKVSFGNEEFTDYLDISASEEAMNEYQIGKDLAKMTMTSTPKVAQIFGKAYNAQLCMVYAPMVNGQAVYDLLLYAPANGEYTIAAPEVENADLYLTKDGSIIWNLSMSEYVVDLTKGNNEGYGLLLQAKAPQTPTGVEQSEVSHQPSDIQKIIINDNVFILRGGQMYDVTGKAVK